jgi:RNA polymerase sigma-70 factor (ECF subfamily)
MSDEDFDRNKIISWQVEMDLKLIEELPSWSKEVLIMRMYQDMSFKEISECASLVNTALGRMRYALMNIRKSDDKHQIVLTLTC